MIKTLTLALSIMLGCLTSANAKIINDRDLEIERLADVGGVAWGMTFLQADQLLITLREGKLYKLDLSSSKLQAIDGLPNDILVVGQGGLFDVRLSPDFANTGWIYFSYNKAAGEKGTTTLARAKLSGNRLTDWQDVFVADAKTNKGVHYGGRLTFDHNGHLYLSVGERGHRPNAQDLTNHAGKVLRLNLDGSVPEDNPFVGQKNVRPEIWSYGHRNPQGLYYNPESNQLWEIEHGPRGGDEINLVQKGHNYGWPEISYGKEYWAPIAVGKGTHQKGMQQPVHKYIPSIAPSSLIQYQGDIFKDWKGDLLLTALSLRHLNHVKVNDKQLVTEEQRLLDTVDNRLRNIIEGPDGLLYVATDDGQIYRIKPKVNIE